MTRHGTDHMKMLSAAGRSKLDQKIAREAGIPDDLPPAEYEARLSAARSAWGLRMAQKRWSQPRPTKISDRKAKS